MSGKRVLFLLPGIIFCVLAVYFAVGLTKDPSQLPSVLINTPVEAFKLPPIRGRENQGREWGLEAADFNGDVALLNVFGSWCISCKVEHPFLMELKRTSDVPVHGIDWREQDATAGPAWLRREGDPYALVGDDPDSKGAIAFGVTGAPETFVVDKEGIIRYKHVGPLDAQVWANVIYPLVQKLRAQQ